MLLFGVHLKEGAVTKYLTRPAIIGTLRPTNRMTVILMGQTKRPLTAKQPRSIKTKEGIYPLAEKQRRAEIRAEIHAENRAEICAAVCAAIPCFSFMKMMFIFGLLSHKSRRQ